MTDMGSIERVRRALHFRYPDRMPLVFRSETERSDIINTGYGTPAGWQPPELNVDEWGIRWDNILGTGCGQIVQEPMAAGEIGSYALPDPHALGRFDDMEATISRFPDRYIAASLGLSGFSRMMSLRGFENLLCDLHLERAFAERLADAVFAFEAGIIEEYGKRGAHGVWLFDDLGTERGPMMSPTLFRQVFKPRYAEQARLVHSLGMDYLLHTCGDMWELIPDLIEAGFDLLNLEQPLVFSTLQQNGIDRLAEHFGGRICFCTNVDSQCTLVYGSIDEVIAEAEHIVRALGRPEGGLIPLADCSKDHQVVTRPENVAAMSDTFVRLAGSVARR